MQNPTTRLDVADLDPLATTESSQALIERALSRDKLAVRALVDLLLPTIRARAARVLARAARGRGIASAVDDVTQQVLLVLFADAGQVLRDWDPERRLSLRQFVGLVAERQALNITRSQRTNPFAEDTLEAETVEARAAHDSPESDLAARELFQEISQRLRAQLSPYGLQMFCALFIEQRSVEQVSADLSMSMDSVYAWHSRLVRQVRTLAEQILSETQRPARSHRSTP